MLDRINHLRKYHVLNEKTLEIGPFHSPIFPKSEFRHVFSSDVFTQETLVANALNDKNISQVNINRIESVDFIWKGSLEETLRGCGSDWALIVSSHNFEHQPDPIKFLIDAEKLLKPGGVLTMAIPIATRCFDAFRPLTTTGAWLDWYGNRQKPSYGIWFDNSVSFCSARNKNMMQHGAFEEQDIHFNSDDLNYSKFDVDREFHEYRDSHCSVMTLESLKLILHDLNRIGLLSRLKMFDCKNGDFEFVVHLSKSRIPLEFYEKNRSLLLKDSVRYYRNELSTLF